MADSVDRVFARAVSTVKKIPRAAGTSRPPLADRLLLYGLYKQATEGDIPEIISRPGDDDDEYGRAKWDAWHSQQGLSKTEAKRRYISSLIDNMTRYATSTREARELVAELSFVWDQIKHQSPQQSSFSDEEVPLRSRLKSAASRGERLTELEPRSQDSRDWEGAVFSDGDGGSDTTNNRRFKRYVNRTIEALKADIADLREEIDTFRVRSSHPSRRNGIITAIGKWIVRFIGFLLRHALFDVFMAVLVWSYLYRRGDDRAKVWARVFSDWIRRRLTSRSRTSEITRNRVSV